MPTILGNATDPTGASTGSNRVDRGGSWFGVASFARVADRGNVAPAVANLRIGFRLSRTGT